MKQKKQPNAFIMAVAIRDEQEAAHRDGREPTSSNAIELFLERAEGEQRLDDRQAGELFDIVFAEWTRITGASIGRISGQKLGTN